ncbi:MAG TPA: ACP phosphodiesterase [Puia sp.]|nr:ACP phosphodiesterase [Puia sp.]
MNYLAHAYLSFENPEMLVGNMISDFVKGKKKYDFLPGIQQGIALHRAIDGFTDSHEITRQAKAYFRKDYGLYAGPLVDVVYDHFLANDPKQFPGEMLASFAEKTYSQLGPFRAVFPEKFARMFPYMQSQNWLYHYRFKEGIVNSFAGLARRAAYMSAPAMAGRILEASYLELGACYTAFFPALKDFAFNFLQQLLRDPDSFNFVG